MKATVLDLDGNQKKEINLPAIFEVEYRPDLINRVVSASQSMQKQPQGRDPMAGKRNTAYSWGPGRGNARVPRINGSGTGAANQGAFAPMTVGGRLAHPPRVAKTLEKKVNKKEKAIAFQSAVSATANPSLVKQRGHIIDGLQTTVLILDDKFQTLKRTSDATRDDIHEVGLDAMCDEVLETSIASLGYTIPDNDPNVIAKVNSMDVIIGKGQANVETLSTYIDEIEASHVFILARIKCTTVASFQGVRVGDNVLRKIK